MQPLLDLPHRRATGLLASGAPVYLLVNPVEYHGPHLSLHNDGLLSQGLIRRLHARLQADHDWPLIVAADLEIGVEPVPGPGSRPLSYATVRAQVRRACEALLELGARKVVLMTFHGAPLHSIALQAGADLLEGNGVRVLSPMNLMLEGLVEFDPELRAALTATIADPAVREAQEADPAFDVHAGFIETSLALALCPEGVSEDYERVAPCPEIRPVGWMRALADRLEGWGRAEAAQQLRFAAWGIGWQRLDPHPGYSGMPHVANEAAGALLLDRVLAECEAKARAIFSGEAANPRPLAEWLATASLGGRLGPSHRPAVSPPESRLLPG